MPNTVNELRRAAACARSSLAQIATIRLVLKLKQGYIDKESDTHIKNPSIIRSGYSDDLTKETQELFIPFKLYLTECPPENPSPGTLFNSGILFNKSAVLLADAVLSKYLKEIYVIMKPIKNWSNEHDSRQGSLTAQIHILFVGDSENNVAPLLSYNNLSAKFKHVKFLDQLRHVIMHNQGEVDGCFYRKCGVDPVSGNSIPSEPQLWGLPSNWTESFFAGTLDEFKKYFELEKQIQIPIENIFGLLKEALQFIDDVCDLCINEIK